MGKERISSQEISDYTNINATQIRRDLSAFGKFGKRGVGYTIDSLLGEIRKILRTQGQHNIALIGAGRLGQAIASSPIFAEHGINIAAVFDTDPEKVGREVGAMPVSHYQQLRDSVRDKNIIVGVIAVPADSAQDVAHELVASNVKTILPTFVLDRYEGLEPRLLQELTPEERERYVEANAAAVRAELPADLVFANHVLLGGPVAAATGAPYAVKAHGSELEYSMRGNAELAAWGRESLANADAVFVGSAHIREVLEDVVGHVDRVHEVPPGVDIDEFVPERRDTALAELLAEAQRDPPNPGNAEERLPDAGNAARFAEFFGQPEPTVV